MTLWKMKLKNDELENLCQKKFLNKMLKELHDYFLTSYSKFWEERKDYKGRTYN
jgi:hypothetical protein